MGRKVKCMAFMSEIFQKTLFGSSQFSSSLQFTPEDFPSDNLLEPIPEDDQRPYPKFKAPFLDGNLYFCQEMHMQATCGYFNLYN